MQQHSIFGGVPAMFPFAVPPEMIPKNLIDRAGSIVNPMDGQPRQGAADVALDVTMNEVTSWSGMRPMRRILMAALAAMVVAAAPHSQAQGAEVPAVSVADFTRYDEFGTIKLSPDGEFLAMSAGPGGRSLLLFFNLKEMKPVHGIKARDRAEILDFDWVSPTRVIYHLAEVQPGHSYASDTGEIGAVERDGSRHQLIYGYRAGESTADTRLARRQSSYATPDVVSFLRGDGQNILITEQPWRLLGNTWRVNLDAVPKITQLNVYTGRKRDVGVAPLASAQVLVDRRDEVRFAVGYNTLGRFTSSWRPQPGADWQAFEFSGFREASVLPWAFTPDETGVLFSGAPEGRSIDGLYRLDLETRTVEEVYAHPQFDVERPIWDAQRNVVIGVRVYADKPEYHWLLPDHPQVRLYRALQRAFAGQVAEVTSVTDDGRLAVVFVWSDVNPGEYYLFDARTMNAEFIRAARAWIDPGEMRPKEPVRIEARDGLVLNGYLTQPRAAGPHPMVVLPHGGPHGIRDHWMFDAEAQLLATRGYAVLQVNFRGSSGYGHDFRVAGYREWGGKVQDDIADATRWAIREGLASENRVCIFGSSFGAYSALMGAVREPGLYRCVIGHAGVYDLELMHSSADIPRSRRGRAYLDEVLGRDLARLRAQSPVHNADRIAAPVLLIHGTADWRADFQHAQRMKQALDKADRPYEWLALKGEGHGIYDERVREQVYTRILAFLQQHLQP
jgi:dipeptidyl aminopeptidase/acylaminoacyl peptidase